MTQETAEQVDHWGRALGAELSTGLSRALYRHWFRVEWEAIENIPRSGGALLVSNHAGMFPVDGAIIQQGVEEELGRPVYTLAHHGFWAFPFLGRYLSRGGAVVGHPENANRLLRDEGQLVLVFPEGAKGPEKTREERYRLQRFGRGGFVETALRAGVPIVPIVLSGTEDATPTVATLRLAGLQMPITLNMLVLGPLGLLAPLPVKIRVRALEPQLLDEPPGLEHYSRSALMDHAEAIRARMQQALDDMRLQRQDLWRG
jgi:1-acyl-sn-glycerol-3-phosphate acyltransferase